MNLQPLANKMADPSHDGAIEIKPVSYVVGDVSPPKITQSARVTVSDGGIDGQTNVPSEITNQAFHSQSAPVKAVISSSHAEQSTYIGSPQRGINRIHGAGVLGKAPRMSVALDHGELGFSTDSVEYLGDVVGTHVDGEDTSDGDDEFDVVYQFKKASVSIGGLDVSYSETSPEAPFRSDSVVDNEPMNLNENPLSPRSDHSLASVDPVFSIANPEPSVSPNSMSPTGIATGPDAAKDASKTIRWSSSMPEIYPMWCPEDYDRGMEDFDTETARIMWELEAPAEQQRMREFRWMILERDLPNDTIHPERQAYLEEEEEQQRRRMERYRTTRGNAKSSKVAKLKGRNSKRLDMQKEQITLFQQLDELASDSETDEDSEMMTVGGSTSTSPGSNTSPYRPETDNDATPRMSLEEQIELQALKEELERVRRETDKMKKQLTSVDDSSIVTGHGEKDCRSQSAADFEHQSRLDSLASEDDIDLSAVEFKEGYSAVEHSATTAPVPTQLSPVPKRKAPPPPRTHMNPSDNRLGNVPRRPAPQPPQARHRHRLSSCMGEEVMIKSPQKKGASNPNRFSVWNEEVDDGQLLEMPLYPIPSGSPKKSILRVSKTDPTDEVFPPTIWMGLDDFRDDEAVHIANIVWGFDDPDSD